jgi:hypothetical protein
VPCFNEAARLDVDAFASFRPAAVEVRFLFVDDGSTDDTLRLLHALAARDPRRFAVLALPRNQGKAAAVRAGLLAALAERPDFVGYWDADLATSLAELPRFLAALAQHPDRDIVFGSRVKLLGRAIERRAARHYLGRVFATLASATLGIAVYDTQCGAKLFRATPALQALLERPFLVGWTFDVEIVARLAAAHRAGQGRAPAERILELPLEAWRDVAGSRVRPIDFPKAFLELLRIHRAYGAPPAARSWRSALAALLLLAVVGQAVWVGLFRDDAVRLLDARVLYAAGQCWRAGGSPYDGERFAEAWQRSFAEPFPTTFVFAYPPTAALVAVPMALLPWPAGGHGLDALSLAALVGCLAAIAAALRAALGARASWSRIALGLALAAAPGAIPATLRLGQTGLLALLGALACLSAARAGPVALFGAGAVLASIKPQVSLLAVGLALAQAGGRRAAWAAAAVGATALAVLAWGGGIHGAGELLAALDRYAQVSSNQGEALAGLQPLLRVLGVSAGTLAPALAGVAIAAVVLPGALRRAPDAKPQLAAQPLVPCALAFALTALFLPLHDYDLVVLMLPMAALVALPLRHALALAPGLLIAARPRPVASLLGQPEAAALVASAGVLATAGLLVWLAARPRR